MEEQLKELRPFFNEKRQLTALPAKHRKLLAAVWYLAGKIDAGRKYTQEEIGDLLDAWTTFHDPATLRRELYNFHLLERTPDGACYWRAEHIPPLTEFLAKYL